MNAMIRKALYITLCTLLAVGLSSCDEESLLTETNPNELSAQTFYETQGQAESAVFAVYANLQTIGLYNRRYYFIHDLLSNEVEGMGSLEPDLGQFNTFQVSAGGNPTLSENWKALTRGVQRANLAVANIPDVPDQQIDSNLRQQLIAEARFLRAWYLYELVTLWGDIPLNLNEDGEPAVATQEELENGVPKVSKDEVYSIILDDLNFAESNLPLKSDYSPENVGRASAAAAAALKGKVHLARSSDSPIGTGADAWDQAEAEFGKFVSGYSNASGEYESEYRLVDDYFDNFTEENENNDESIFEVQFDATGSANWSEQGSGVFEETFRNQEYAFNGWRNVIPSRKLVEEYENNDPRLNETVYFPGDTWGAGQTVDVPDDFPSWRKYQKTYRSEENSASSNSGINFRVIRLAEVYLSLADAKIELGKGQEARDLMNEVRSRPSVNMPEYPTSEYPASIGNKQELLDALYHEVAVEHAGEQVLHKFQQRRPEYLEEWATGPEYNPTGVNGDVDAGFELPKAVLMPILQQEIDANNALSSGDQNPGY